MKKEQEENAIVYCAGAFNTTNGKTAHGLVRRSERYRVVSLIDPRYAGQDAGQVLDGRPKGIPIVASLQEALALAQKNETPASHFVFGVAPDGGRLGEEGKAAVTHAVQSGLHAVCGLHDFLSDDPQLADLARQKGVQLIDIRRPPERSQLHFFSGKIGQVKALRVALLGSDSAVGKRTTAWILVDALRAAGISSELLGTGQTAWLQGAQHGIILDSLVNDFVSGELEHAAYTLWQETQAQALVIEGQGSLMNPAYPGGFEILAATRPHCVVLQHAPARREYDGFPGFPIQPLTKQIDAVEFLSDKPVVAITINSEGMDPATIEATCRGISKETGLPVVEPLRQSLDPVLEAVKAHLPG